VIIERPSQTSDPTNASGRDKSEPRVNSTEYYVYIIRYGSNDAKQVTITRRYIRGTLAAIIITWISS
jgi:hypothetical protein